MTDPTTTLPGILSIGQRRAAGGTFPSRGSTGGSGDPGGQARLQIRVCDETNLDGDEDKPGPEVNPDGESCP